MYRAFSGFPCSLFPAGIIISRAISKYQRTVSNRQVVRLLRTARVWSSEHLRLSVWRPWVSLCVVFGDGKRRGLEGAVLMAL